MHHKIERVHDDPAAALVKLPAHRLDPELLQRRHQFVRQRPKVRLGICRGQQKIVCYRRLAPDVEDFQIFGFFFVESAVALLDYLKYGIVYLRALVLFLDFLCRGLLCRHLFCGRQEGARSRSQLGRSLALTLETMPMAAYRVMMDDPP